MIDRAAVKLNQAFTENLTLEVPVVLFSDVAMQAKQFHSFTMS